ncbi:MAG: hypothetical protein HF981_01560 [Desulfobacteraceae bacterium]|nr:hypothetical protein [Desulfobacteraceae bacterium]MBC2749048.1 hypothetical protein [Desulfobacteraceae bacterium]
MKHLPYYTAIIIALLASFIHLPHLMAQQTETIISKEDADRIYGMTLPEWEAYVRAMEFPPDWEVRIYPLNTGTGITGFDPQTQTGLSIQPLYLNDESPPEMLVVGSYYPIGSRPNPDEDFIRYIEKTASEDLGSGYRVSATAADLPNHRGIELTVTRTQ